MPYLANGSVITLSQESVSSLSVSIPAFAQLL